MFTNMMIMIAVTMISLNSPLRARTILHSDIQLRRIKYTRILLLLAKHLDPLEVGTGADELLNLLDLEDPV